MQTQNFNFELRTLNFKLFVHPGVLSGTPKNYYARKSGTSAPKVQNVNNPGFHPGAKKCESKKVRPQKLQKVISLHAPQTGVCQFTKIHGVNSLQITWLLSIFRAACKPFTP
jgi:hypothetical protein